MQFGQTGNSSFLLMSLPHLSQNTKTSSVYFSPSKTLRHQRQLVDRLVGSSEGVVDSKDVIGVPSAERLLIDDAGALTNDLSKLLLVGHSDDSLSGGVALSFL